MREGTFLRYSSRKSERSSSWFTFQPHDQWKICLVVSLLILAVSIGFFVWCTRVSNDLGGDSFAGLVFAVGCTIFLFLAAVSFSLQRRSRKRVVGKLNGVLNWHICFGVIALVMVFLHASGTLSLDGRGLAGSVEEKVLQAFNREEFLRYLLRYWRIFHIVLAVVTVGLTLWHIEYAFSLIIPAFQKYGIGYLLPWP